MTTSLLSVFFHSQVYRHSFLANYFIFTLSDKSVPNYYCNSYFFLLSNSIMSFCSLCSTIAPVADSQVLQYVEWSPTSSNIVSWCIHCCYICIRKEGRRQHSSHYIIGIRNGQQCVFLRCTKQGFNSSHK